MESYVPKKSLGQNFLINSGVLHKILSSAEISKDDVILEVGPGKGTLTEELAKKHAVEYIVFSGKTSPI